MKNPQQDPVRVLVVDDSAAMRDNLNHMLKDFAYITASAVDGRDALKVYKKFHPHIILLDMYMPRMNGLAVIHYIRKKLDDQEVLIIMLTSEKDPNLKLKAFGVGANDFLHKPFDRPELLARVGVAARQIRLNAKLRRAYDTISREIDLVASLQRKLLPTSDPNIPGVELKSLYKPSGRASGDYFDFFCVGDNILRIIMADVSGHGARAAFIMSIVRTLFRAGVTHQTDLSSTIHQIERHLRDIIGQEPDFITLLAADLDFDDRVVTYVNCGHCPGILKPDTGESVLLSPTTTVVGFFDVDAKSHTASLPENGCLFLYTDGFYEWETASGDLLDFENFKQAAESLMDEEDFLEKLLLALENVCEKPCRFRDDLTALTVRMALS